MFSHDPIVPINFSREHSSEVGAIISSLAF